MAAGDPCGGAGRGPRAHRHGMVSAERPGADARLFPRRGRGWIAVLDLPGRALRQRTRHRGGGGGAFQLVRAWAVRMNNVAYAEIGITTNFSFLRAGPLPQDYVHEASKLRLPVIGIADHNTLAGVVRAYKELDNSEITDKPKLLIGSRLVFMDGTPDILVYSRDRAAYGRLCQLLTRGKRGDDTEKGECHLKLENLLEFAEGQLLAVMLPHRFEAATALDVLDRLQCSRADGVWLAASLLYRGDDRRRLARLHRPGARAPVAA